MNESKARMEETRSTLFEKEDVVTSIHNTDPDLLRICFISLIPFMPINFFFEILYLCIIIVALIIIPITLFIIAALVVGIIIAAAVAVFHLILGSDLNFFGTISSRLIARPPKYDGMRNQHL